MCRTITNCFYHHTFVVITFPVPFWAWIICAQNFVLMITDARLSCFCTYWKCFMAFVVSTFPVTCSTGVIFTMWFIWTIKTVSDTITYIHFFYTLIVCTFPVPHFTCKMFTCFIRPVLAINNSIGNLAFWNTNRIQALPMACCTLMVFTVLFIWVITATKIWFSIANFFFIYALVIGTLPFAWWTGKIFTIILIWSISTIFVEVTQTITNRGFFNTKTIGTFPISLHASVIFAIVLIWPVVTFLFAITDIFLFDTFTVSTFPVSRKTFIIFTV